MQRRLPVGWQPVAEDMPEIPAAISAMHHDAGKADQTKTIKAGVNHPLSITFQKLGQPVPLSYLCAEEIVPVGTASAHRGALVFSSLNGLLKARSLRAWRGM
jgi:hypothetical protein